MTWVHQIVCGSFERAAIGSAVGQPVQAHPMSDPRDRVVPGQGFVLTRLAPAREAASAAADLRAEAKPRPTPAPMAPNATAAAPAATVLSPASALLPSVTQAVLSAPPASAGEPAPGAFPGGDGTPAVPGGPGPRPERVGRSQPVAPTVAMQMPPGTRPWPSRPTATAKMPLGMQRSDGGLVAPPGSRLRPGREPQHDPLVQSGVASPVVMTDLDNEVLSFEFAGPPDER